MRSSARAAPGAAAARPVGDNAKGLAAWRPAAPPGGLPGGWTKEKAVLSDLAVLTPPLVVCAALLIAIGALMAFNKFTVLSGYLSFLNRFTL